MNCIKCGTELRDAARFCDACGANQQPKRHVKKRGNGQGSVIKLPNGKYQATVTLGYLPPEPGHTRPRRKTRSRIFPTKREAVAALATLGKQPDKRKSEISFSDLYEKWLPTHQASKSTIDCYKAAYKHFEDIYFYKVSDIDIDDLQECISGCGKGRRTQENMRALVGLMYKYGIPRGMVAHGLNLAEYLKVAGEHAAERESFTSEQIKAIRDQIGKTPFAEYVYCLIYLGYRPSEFLSLDASSYDRRRNLFVHGAKTAAGKDRYVTISPKIQPYIDVLCKDRISGPVFRSQEGESFQLKYFTENIFYSVLDAAGIDNPLVEIAGGVTRHKYTPHSCRHTFATLLKAVAAPSKDKQKLIGHSSEEMLRYYQDVEVEDLRKITDAI